MRHIRLATAAVVIVGLGASMGIAAAAPSPSDVYGCVVGQGQGHALPTVSGTPSGTQIGGGSCTFVAPGPVAYAGAGTFTVTVSHPQPAPNPPTVTTYDSTQSAEAPFASGETVAVAGDTITVSADATNGGLVAAGTDPCVEAGLGSCPAAP